MECGLLGRKLGHSYSPQIHACLGDYSYTLVGFLQVLLHFQLMVFHC